MDLASLSLMMRPLDNGVNVGFMTIPWSWVILIAIVVVGLLLIRTAITLVKVAIIVAIGFAIWYVVQYLLNNFS